MIQCPLMRNLHGQRTSHLKIKVKPHNWIFGSRTVSLNPVIWVANFSMYNSHLIVCNGDRVCLWEAFVQEAL